MRQQKLFRQIFKYFLFIIIPSLILIALYTTNSFKDFYYARTTEELEGYAKTIEKKSLAMIGSYKHRTENDISDPCFLDPEDSNFRVTLILPDGEVICDTTQNAESMENHKNRPEIAEALHGNVGRNIRYSDTLQETLMYVAVPLKENTTIVGILRTAVSISLLNHTLESLWIKISSGGILIIFLAGVIAFWVSKKISLPLEILKKGVEKYSLGNLDHKLESSPIAEINGLSESMGKMALQLKERISMIIRQQSREKIILAAMSEGIIALDTDKRILTINQAACSILKIESASLIGERLEKITRVLKFSRIVQKAISSGEVVDEEIVIYNENEQYLRIQGTPLSDNQGIRFGTLIVIHDLTKLHALEKVRKEFAVNVSHELKTPLTSIKGFVETLQNDEPENKKKTGHFLSIIGKETDRIIAIVEDLLSLARIEKEEESHDLEMEKRYIRDLLNNAIAACERQASAKNIIVELSCSPSISGSANAHLLTQAVINLIDNAIKYSDPEGKITVSAEIVKDTIEIAVKDHGCGIPEEHLPRIFERFYRVDKARSRELGGTGLGLAIVKHIIHIHRGSVDVKSSPGKGSTFFLYIPFQQ
ncbi:MAG: PAS domain-containing protein [Spirochaetales bacterium]|nr:PAS domain-containing protein [Spirochaetales bacterium]